MAPATVKHSIYIWLEFVLILAANLGVMFALLYLNSPNIRKIIQPIFVSLFMTITTYNRGAGESISFYYLFLLTLIFSFIPFTNKSNEERDLSEQENDTIENNEDNQREENSGENQNRQEENSGEKPKKNSGEKPKKISEEDPEQNLEQNPKQEQSFLERLNSVNVITAFFVLFSWVDSVQNGINDEFKYYYRYLPKFEYQLGQLARSQDDLTYYVVGVDNNGNLKVLINLLFYHLFLNATYQFFYGIMVLNDNSPKWLYLFYMIPQAVLYPVSCLLSYYVAQVDSWSFFNTGDRKSVV